MASEGRRARLRLSPSVSAVRSESVCEEAPPPIVRAGAGSSDRVPSAARRTRSDAAGAADPSGGGVAVAVGPSRQRRGRAFRNGARMKRTRARWTSNASARCAEPGWASGGIGPAPALAALAANARTAAAAGRHRVDRRHGCGREADEHVARHAADHLGPLCDAGDPSVPGHLSAPVDPSAAHPEALAASVPRRPAALVHRAFFRRAADDVAGRSEHHRVHDAADDHRAVGRDARRGRRRAAVDRRRRRDLPACCWSCSPGPASSAGRRCCR